MSRWSRRVLKRRILSFLSGRRALAGREAVEVVGSDTLGGRHDEAALGWRRAYSRAVVDDERDRARAGAEEPAADERRPVVRDEERDDRRTVGRKIVGAPDGLRERQADPATPRDHVERPQRGLRKLARVRKRPGGDAVTRRVLGRDDVVDRQDVRSRYLNRWQVGRRKRRRQVRRRRRRRPRP